MTWLFSVGWSGLVWICSAPIYTAILFMKNHTRLALYECLQVTVDLLCENIILVHCSVVVYNHTSPFFLCLKECAIITECGSTVLWGLIRETRLTKLKLFFNVHIYWTAWNVPSLIVISLSNDLLAVKTKYCMEG